jgi:anti-sigma factor RsiW
MTCTTWQSRIEAYVDSELPAEAMAELESHLRICPSCAADALGRLQMKRATQAAGVRYAPAPQFRRQVEQSIRKKHRAFWLAGWMRKLAAGAAALVLLVASAVLWVRQSERNRTLTELADLHVATLASTNPVDVVSTDRHTVKPWFAGKLPFTFNLPELQNSPFQLVGGRLVYLDRNPGAQLLFQIRKHELSVFILPHNPGMIPFAGGTATARTLNFNVESWTQGGLWYGVISDASAADVHQLGELFRQAARS